MLLESSLSILDGAEKNARVTSRRDVVLHLRQVGLDDFGQILIGMPDKKYPKVSGLLPKMASEQVQRDWTGNHGLELLKQTNTFVRFLATAYITQTNSSLDNIQVLDFGCGYGRLIRSMYYYVSPDNIFGVDPWDRSVSECVNNGISSNIFLSGYLPKDLPINNRRFELIYAFSVFTHLSSLAAKQALNTLRNYISPNGVLVITIRPVEYWAGNPKVPSETKERMEMAHRSVGFAFSPHNIKPIEGDVTYGETSMTIAWLRENFPQWKVAAIDHPLLDPYQLFVVLRPV
jgi:SAM-dependent methyltransferase